LGYGSCVFIMCSLLNSAWCGDFLSVFMKGWHLFTRVDLPWFVLHTFQAM
jgi:hypothetical protein